MYKARADAEAHRQPPTPFDASRRTVLARVDVWGRLVEHDRGWRAERLKIVELFVPSALGDFAMNALADRYQLPVTISEAEDPWTSASPFASSRPSLSRKPLSLFTPNPFSFQHFLSPFPSLPPVYWSPLAEPGPPMIVTPTWHIEGHKHIDVDPPALPLTGSVMQWPAVKDFLRSLKTP